MAPVTPLGYRPGGGPVHRLDPRLKLAAVALIGVLSLDARWGGLLVLTAVLFGAARSIRGFLPAFAAGSRPVMLLLALVVLSRGWFTPGTALFDWGGIVLTREGVLAGAMVAWRIGCVLLAGAVVVAATPTEQLAGAAAWFLGPVPGINAQRVGMQLALVVRFIPLMLRQAAATRDAQRARCVDRLRSPARRIHYLVVPTARRMFAAADRTALAMASRCYGEPRTRPRWSPGRLDAAAALISAATALALVFL